MTGNSRRRPVPAGTWTRESLVKAFQAEVKETGRMPSTTSWKITTDKHPNSARINQLFGRWNNLVRAAGFEPRTPQRNNYELQWSDDEIISHLQDWALEHGRVPASGEWAAEASPARPSMATVRNRFGGWNAALKAAELVPFVERNRPWTREEALAALESEFQRTRRLPTSSQWSARRLRPSARVCYRLFGSWPAFMQASGHKHQSGSRLTEEALFEELDNWIEAHGHLPSSHDWRYAEGDQPHWPVVRRMFGSWTAFMRAAGYLE